MSRAKRRAHKQKVQAQRNASRAKIYNKPTDGNYGTSRRKSRIRPKASEVTIINTATGEITTQPAYTPAEMKRIQGQRANSAAPTSGGASPIRKWEDISSRNSR